MIEIGPNLLSAIQTISTVGGICAGLFFFYNLAKMGMEN